MDAQTTPPPPKTGWAWWFWALLAAPIVAIGAWWAWNESAIFPLSDGEYWCSETVLITGLYAIGNDYAVVLKDGEPVSARPVQVSYAPNTESGAKVTYGKKFAPPTEITQQGHDKFEVSKPGYSVVCEFMPDSQ